MTNTKRGVARLVVRSTVTATKPVGRCCTDAVLVLGATGKTGRCVVRALLAQGRNVVVAARKKEAADDLFDKSAPGLYFQVTVWNVRRVSREEMLPLSLEGYEAVGTDPVLLARESRDHEVQNM